MIDALAAHQAVHRLNILFFSLRADVFQPHGTGGVAGAALGTSGAILFQLEQIELIENAQQIANGTHDAPEPLDEGAAYQQGNGQNAAQHKVDLVASQGRGKYLVGANVTEVPASEGEAEEQDDPCPFQRLQYPVHTSFALCVLFQAFMSSFRASLCIISIASSLFFKPFVK